MADSADQNEKTKVLSGESETLKKEMERAGEACLIIIRGNPQGHRFFVSQAQMVIGREATCDIPLADNGISRKHAVVTKEADKIIITDQGSSNGTFVNDKKINANEPYTLAKEDMIRMGNFILKYLPKGHLEILAYGNLGDAAHTDPMTKTYNKGYLLEALEAEFKRARALHTDFTVLFLDIDHFKKVNDTYGHDAGDYVLKEFSTLIRTSFVRPKDVLARYGGEEFVLLFSNTNAEQAREIAEKIRASVQTHAFIYEGKRIPITSSFGVSEMTATVDSASKLLKNADQALYKAKQGGRNQFVVFTS